MPTWIFPLLYICLFTWLLYKKQSLKGLPLGRWLPIAFLAKVMAGFANYAIWLYVIGHGDSLNYIHDADLIYGTLFHEPLHYLQLTFGWQADNQYPAHLLYISEPLKYAWNNIEYNMVRINAVLHIFTFGNAWANIVILDFIYFLGALYLYRVLVQFYPRLSTWIFLLMFFLPSITIWSSGLLKEGPSLFLMEILAAQLILREHRASGRKWWVILCALAGMLAFRQYYTILLIPALLLWWVAIRMKLAAWKIFGIAGIFSLIFIATADYLSYRFTVSEIICEAQQYFIAFGTDPDYQYHLFTGYELTEPIRQFPNVLNNILFRPNILHSSDPFRIYQSIELMLTLGLLGWLIISRKGPIPASVWLLSFFSVALLLMFGYVVTDADTMSRYRSIPVFLLLLSWLITRYPAKE